MNTGAPLTLLMAAAPSCPTGNSQNSVVERAIDLGCVAPVFSFAKFPELGRCWLDRAEWLIAKHHEMTPEQRARAIRECDVYSGAPLPQSYFRVVRRPQR